MYWDNCNLVCYPAAAKALPICAKQEKHQY